MGLQRVLAERGGYIVRTHTSGEGGRRAGRERGDIDGHGRGPYRTLDLGVVVTEEIVENTACAGPPRTYVDDACELGRVDLERP